MAGINKRLGASTLVEVIVAALILMIVFAVTMETLVRFSVQDSEPIELTDAVTAVRTYYRLSGKEEENETLEYKWGKIRVDVKPYRPGFRQVTLTVIPGHGQYKPVFVYLK
ncbi:MULTISPECIES: hypothetical protein [Culturomica]|jgi:hypothetical protein|uniref:hypothetical protein n=1 Tax=Culturomica TaxID=1926651 RepID=UPI00033D070C|nr:MULTISPECIES: hypothetical protein [Culturomica]CCZ08342.1 putative uncharacterized protein [Odoribacter sp. CAG:788]HBO28136.1 hypothetical protein [Culturomica sp.]